MTPPKNKKAPRATGGKPGKAVEKEYANTAQLATEIFAYAVFSLVVALHLWGYA